MKANLELNADRKILSELGNRKRLDILTYLNENGWCSSVMVARAVKLHTAIVSRFLTLCAEYGILERRFVKRRRGYYEYRLKYPEFYLKVSVAPQQIPEKIKFISALLAYCERVFGKAKALEIKSALDKKLLASIEAKDGNARAEELELAEKKIFEEIARITGIENARKILVKIQEEIKNEKGEIGN